MKIKTLYLIFSLFLVSGLLDKPYICQQISNKKSYSLSPVLGNEFYKGKSDCKANTQISIDSNKIIINVNVIDDNLILEEDPTNSDHVEIWIAIPEAIVDNISYIMISDSSLWLVNGGSDIEEFKYEIENPLISTTLPEDVRYDQLVSLDELGIREKVDFQLTDHRIGEAEKVYVLYGQTHYGVMPNSAKLHQYDREYLYQIVRSLECNPNDITKECVVSSTVNKSGYSITIKISPRALNFFSKGSLNELRILVDVVDIDKNEKGKTLLSISNNRQWGKAETFISLQVNKQFGDSSLISSFPPENIEDIGIPVFYNSSSGWIPISKKIEEYIYPHRISPMLFPNLSSVKFFRSIFSHKSDSLGEYRFSVYSLPYENSAVGQRDLILFENGQKVFVEQFVKSFLLPSKKPAFLTSNYEFTMGGCFATGYCGCNIESYLYLQFEPFESVDENFKLLPYNGNQLCIAHFSGCGYDISFGDSITINDFDIESYFSDIIHGEGVDEFGNSFDWMSIIKLNPNGDGLTINLPKGIQVTVWWDEFARTIYYKIIED